ncbi:hypothetical protein [Bacillus sp. NPDC094106]|uniref:hypothetical protein n=1 Tax=Bacillus sp. NPDC094106 TaxID=3363949 RepID=UPI0037F164D2
MNAFGFSGWQLFLGGISAGIHNATIYMKAPFRKILCNKYKKKYNDESIFVDFSKDMKDIHVWNRFYNHASCGQGLFLYHLLQSYQMQDIPVKLITTTEQISEYLSFHYDYSVVNINAETTNDLNGKMNYFIESDANILSLNTSSLARKSLHKKTLFLRTMFEKIANISVEENVIYLVCLLHVDKEDKALLEDRKNIRLIHFRPETQINKIDTLKLNIHIPHMERAYKKSYLEQVKSTFPNVADWVYTKDYFSYHHFVFNNEGKTGFYFMDSKKRRDEK